MKKKKLILLLGCSENIKFRGEDLYEREKERERKIME